MSGRVVSIAVLVLLAASATPALSEHPAAITIGGASVPRAGQASRADLLGDVDLYSLAIYVPGGRLDPDSVVSREVPKGLRIEVTYRSDLRRKLTLDWQRELIPRLDQQAVERLRGIFAPLRHGDVVSIEYVPDKGTIVRVNESVAVPGASHDLILAFLDHWLGQRPVSEEIKRALLGGA